MLCDDTKPLPEPMLNYHLRDLCYLHGSKFSENTYDISLLVEYENNIF